MAAASGAHGLGQFVRYLKTNDQSSNWTERSAAMELSLNGEVPRWHLHLAITNLDGDQSADKALYGLVTVQRDHTKQSALAAVVRKHNRGRGRGTESSIQRMHAYCPLDKKGSLYSR